MNELEKNILIKDGFQLKFMINKNRKIRIN